MKDFDWNIDNSAGTHSIQRSIQEQGKSPRKNGHLVFRQNPLRYRLTKVTCDQGTVTVRSKKTGNAFLQINAPSSRSRISRIRATAPGTQALTAPPGIRESADQKMLAKVSSVRVNLLDLYRTRYETSRMVVKTINRLTSAYRAIRHQRWRDASEFLGISISPPKGRRTSPPSLWLEYQYGWKPFVQDVYTMINKPFANPTLICKARVTFSDSKRLHYICMMGSGLDNAPNEGDLTMRVRGHSTSRIKVVASNAALQAASQYGVDNPALLAWEALPYSFVVDWFYPVGSYLERLTAFHGLEFSEYSNTTVTHSESDFMDGLWTIDRYYNYQSITTPSVRRIKEEYKEVTRTITGLTLNPWPSFKSPFSLTHVANALSLMSTAFSRKHFSSKD